MFPPFPPGLYVSLFFSSTGVKPPSQEKSPRPGFPLPPGQKHLGPLVLDNEQKIQVPAPINTYLRDYQREGVKFFWERYNEGRGALLGDDMGAATSLLDDGVKTDRKRRRKHVSALQDGKDWKKHKALPPANATWPTCLIIAPSTVVRNWEREFETWGYFEVGSYVGTRKERTSVLQDFKKGRLDVVLTSLDLARRDIDLLESLPWSCIIVDEVHTVKNPKSKTSIAYNSFDCVRRFGLTGTAIQNSYDELWTILDWTNPGKLGDSAQWRGFISNPLKLGQSASAADGERIRAVAVSQILHHKILPRFFLRRTKAIIAHQLPKKSDQVVFCPLTPIQIKVYKRLLATPEVEAMLLRDEPCPCGAKLRYSSPLVRNREYAAIAFPDGNAPAYGTAIMQPRFCGKWTVLLSLLKEWREDRTNKALIFTKSVKLLEMLSHLLKVEGYGFLQLDGSTKQSDRMPMIDQFHADPNVFVFLISTMAGGTGLNLTGANKVVIFDPAHDLQAMDRAFRFGQTRDVFVFRLLGAGSIEELIYARQVYKQQQMQIGYEASIQTRYFEGVQGDKSKQGELFGLANIFKLHEGGLSTKMTIEKAHLAELDWALASMDAPQAKKKSDIDIVEVETKLDKEYGDLKGLGALLFDDGLSPPATSQKRAAIRGMYTHQNADLLVTSKVEQERTKDIVKVKLCGKEPNRKASHSLLRKHGRPGNLPPWPPPRSRNKKKQHDQPLEQRLKERVKAIIATGMIDHPSELDTFLHTLYVPRSCPEIPPLTMCSLHVYTPEERAYTLRVINEYREEDSDDSRDGDVHMQAEMEPEDIDME
ncbi:P-loop containing nucleoside triphosphate hydrolase protein [Mycena epipterygia]|nr:P-loop containing nucleoside triphosphate hydrolase protein [Mycena epipterygia]